MLGAGGGLAWALAASGRPPLSAGWSSGVAVTAGDPLVAVSCTGRTFCMAVDGHDAYEYSGRAWSPGTALIPSAGGQDNDVLTTVSCVSPTFCVAMAGLYADVSRPFSDEAFTFDGRSWSAGVAVGGRDHDISSVSCPSRAFCMAVGGNGSALGVGAAYRYDGHSWSFATPVAVAGVGLSSVSCASSRYCVAGGGYGYSSGNTPGPGPGRNAGLYVYAGHGWSAAPGDLGVSQAVEAVSCTRTKFCIAASTSLGPGLGVSSAITRAGHSWSDVPGTINAIDALSCTSPAFCMAAGGSTASGPDIAGSDLGGQAYVYAGGSWSTGQQLTSAVVGVGDVSCVSPAFCAAVGNNGDGYVYSGG
jgi:hypothetical protein